MRFFSVKNMIISHLTDVEGNLNYFTKWFNRSKYLEISLGNLSFRNLKQNHLFIYGGDVCDKGPGDLRIARSLVDFKKKYPQKVFLIAGNREIKCRRFTAELTNNIHQRLLQGAPAFWNPKLSPRQYVMQQMQAEGVSFTSAASVDDYIHKKSKEECQTLYLKWMLNETMGCGAYRDKPNTFEYRRMELAEMAGVSLHCVSDHKVTASFIDSVSPEGVISQYLQQAQLGKIIGDTLFIHGAITSENMGYVPGMSETAARITNAKEWIDLLNQWYDQQINDWLNNPAEEGLFAPGHKPLDKYVIHNPKSIVTTNWYSHNKLTPINDELVKFLNQAGIYRVVTGHQPFSDFPLIIRHKNLEVIVGDTSYSDPFAPKDNRGHAIHNLDITGSDKRSFSTIDAIRQDGSTMRLDLPQLGKVASEHGILIGHFTPHGLIRPLNNVALVSSQLDGYEIVDTPLNGSDLTNNRIDSM